jgi:hypothetical protein
VTYIISACAAAPSLSCSWLPPPRSWQAALRALLSGALRALSRARGRVTGTAQVLPGLPHPDPPCPLSSCPVPQTRARDVPATRKLQAIKKHLKFRIYSIRSVGSMLDHGQGLPCRAWPGHWPGSCPCRYQTNHSQLEARPLPNSLFGV